MDDTDDRRNLPAGVPVVDTDGDRVGTIRAVYPHYVAVEADGEPAAAYRVPFRAIFAFDGDTVTLRVQKDALDPMTPEELTAFGLPTHGGEAPIGTGTDNVGPAAGFTFGGVQVGDGEPGSRPPEDAAALAEALADADLPEEREHSPGSRADPDVGAAYGTDGGNSARA